MAEWPLLTYGTRGRALLREIADRAIERSSERARERSQSFVICMGSISRDQSSRSIVRVVNLVKTAAELEL